MSTTLTRISRALARAAVPRARPLPHISQLRSPSASWSHPLRAVTANINRRGISTTPPHRAPPTHDSDDADLDVRIEDEGEYEMIGPSENPAEVLHLPRRPVPAHIVRPPYARSGAYDYDEEKSEGIIELGSRDEARLRAAARLAARVLHATGVRVLAGVLRTTDAIDAFVHDMVVAHGAYPSPLEYKGFPRSCCTSVNNIVAHGIPDNRELRDGDIVNVDITVYLAGFHGDTSATFCIGSVDTIGLNLVSTTTSALDAAIAACGPDQPFRGIADAIHGVISGKGYVVCPSFTGHGIGRVFHQPPWVYHDRNGEPERMRPGHCFTIEPCIIQGADPGIVVYPDGWTASTSSFARSAQAEHMVLITDTGAEVLTRP